LRCSPVPENGAYPGTAESTPQSQIHSDITATLTSFNRVSNYNVGRDSSVGTGTRYGLDCPGIEYRRGRDFPHPSRPALGPTQLPIQWVPGLCRGKATGGWRWPPTPVSAEVKERVQLYLYSPFGPSWPVLGWVLPLPLPSNYNFSLPRLLCVLMSLVPHSPPELLNIMFIEGYTLTTVTKQLSSVSLLLPPF